MQIGTINFPKSINVYGVKYEIVQTDTEPPQEGEEPNTLWLGRAYEDSCKIYINKNIPNIQKKWQVLLHELSHVILFENALTFESVGFEETVVQVMANGFLQFMQDLKLTSQKEV